MPPTSPQRTAERGDKAANCAHSDVVTYTWIHTYAHAYCVHTYVYIFIYTYIYMYIYMYMPTGGFPYGCVHFLQIAFFLGLALAHMLDAMAPIL